jgi:hypothetical protein
MSYAEMTEIGGGVRDLTDAELAMVAGGGPGGFWGDVAKGLGALVGRAVGGAVGGFIGAIFVSGLIAGADTTSDCATKGTNCSHTAIEDAAL